MAGSDLVHQKWKSDYKKLHEEIDLFMAHFSTIKKCKCEIEDCKHFERQRDKIFGKKIDDVFNSSLKDSFQAFAKITKSERRH
jgi:hypothetical protein